MNKTEAVSDKEINTAGEQQLATDLELISLLRENPDILQRHPELLVVLEVPHQAGAAVSLIERQIAILRKQTSAQDERLHELIEVAHDNVRLAKICKNTMAY